ncbi:coatomer epsilon [Cyclospora cayetanensis]|uniref:Coatomer epsilon n=1 Tax=Cyclospora cayetanensis TaxID=88456 RepID=A0A1D3CWN2_9EIME|nr:coatomer epsilon [Cyclospora cayetanensis]
MAESYDPSKEGQLPSSAAAVAEGMLGYQTRALQLYAAGYYKAAGAEASAIRATDSYTEQQREFLVAACEQQKQLLLQSPHVLQKQHPQQLQQMLHCSNPAIQALALFLLSTRYCQTEQHPERQQMQKQLQELGRTCAAAAFLAAASAAETNPASGAYETAEQSISRALYHLWEGDAVSAEASLTDAEMALSLRAGDVSALIENGPIDAFPLISVLPFFQAPWDESALCNAICCFRRLHKNALADELSERLTAGFPNSAAAKNRIRLREVFLAESATDVPL